MLAAVKRPEHERDTSKGEDLPRMVPRSAHVLWIGVSISLLIGLYLAYLETVSKSYLDIVLPRTNVTVAHYQNGTTTVNQTGAGSGPFLSTPQVPRFIIIWGYIGSAAYLLKVVTGYLGKGRYKTQFLPYHIARLFIGPALAVVIYFILETGSFFGLSFDITKVSLQLLPYLYAGVAFLTGYFARSIIETLSKVINGIFNLDTSEEGSKQANKSSPQATIE
jgi:hypothetical protein